MGVADQWTISEHGKLIPRKRATHGCYFPNKSGNSLNNQILDKELESCIFGHCLRRLLHQIHRLRLAHPKRTIYIIKHDLDAAYRPIHVHPDFAIRATTVIGEIAYILTRFSFGVSAAPSMYSLISEAFFDRVNDLLTDPVWNPKSLHSPHKTEFQKPKPFHNSIPFDKANKLHVDVPLRKSFCDGYIDDCITISLDEEELIEKSQNALPLGVHTVFRPLMMNEPTERNDSLQITKLKGEGTPSKSQCVLG